LRNTHQHGDIISAKIRWLAIAAGCFSVIFGAAAFGSLFLILGTIVQPRASTSGRWLMWIGTILLTTTVISFGPGVILEQVTLLRQGGKIGVFIIFVIATVLVLWCDVVMLKDALRVSHNLWARGSLDWLVWVAAIALTAVCAWTGRLTVDMYKQGTGLGLDNLLFTVGLDVIVGLFDVALMIHAVKRRRVN